MEGFEQQERYPWEENIAVPEGGADPEGAAPADYAYGEVEEPDAGQQNMYEGGNADDGWYRAYQKPPKQKKEGGGFGVKLLKCAALAVVFGLLAGSSFVGTTHFFGKVTGRDAAPEEEAAPSGADLSIAAEPEAVGSFPPARKQAILRRRRREPLPTYRALSDSRCLPSCRLRRLPECRRQGSFSAGGRNMKAKDAAPASLSARMRRIFTLRRTIMSLRARRR